jgi:hypothetical protein
LCCPVAVNGGLLPRHTEGDLFPIEVLKWL